VPQFYLLGPNIDGISEGFEEKDNAIFYKTNYSLVENKTIDIYSKNKMLLHTIQDLFYILFLKPNFFCKYMISFDIVLW
jgi:hypothetical protein